MNRLPIFFGALAALATLLLIGPIAIAVVLLRSSTDAQGPSLAAQILIAALLLALTVAAGLGTWRLTRFAVDRLRRG